MILKRLSAAAVLVVAAPAAALACPVCGLAGTGDNIDAYRSMTVMLSGVPLGLIAGVVIWVVRRVRRGPDPR